MEAAALVHNAGISTFRHASHVKLSWTHEIERCDVYVSRVCWHILFELWEPSRRGFRRIEAKNHDFPTGNGYGNLKLVCLILIRCQITGAASVLDYSLFSCTGVILESRFPGAFPLTEQLTSRGNRNMRYNTYHLAESSGF